MIYIFWGILIFIEAKMTFKENILKHIILKNTCWKKNAEKSDQTRKNILNQWHEKKSLHNTDPPQKINRAWIIFKKLDTIPTHCANQEPTLIDFHHCIAYGHTWFLVAQKVLARWSQNAELRMVFVAFLLITTFSIMNMIVSAHTSAVHCWLLLWVPSPFFDWSPSVCLKDMRAPAGLRKFRTTNPHHIGGFLWFPTIRVPQQINLYSSINS